MAFIGYIFRRMKHTLLICFTALFCMGVFGQKTADEYYNDGMKYAQRKQYKEAVQFFDMALRLRADDYYTMYNRGIAKSLMGSYYPAIEDFKTILTAKPDYVKAYVALGNCYKRLTHYDTAINYYSDALYFDTANLESYYHRAHVYEALCMNDSAKADFVKAQQLGAKVDDKLKFYDNIPPKRNEIHTITKLTVAATDANYGFNQKNPIKVGASTKGGFENVRNYLALLRDAKKKPVRYNRIKACCPYKPAGFGGNVFLEEYSVTYFESLTVEKTVTMYFTYYEYEDPKIPVGFTAAK